MPRDTCASKIALAYIGSVIPDELRHEANAFSRSGNMTQCNLLNALNRAGVRPSLIVSVFPLRSFFSSGRLIFKGIRSLALNNGDVAYAPPYINITPLKQLMIGCETFLKVLCWGLRNRRCGARIIYQFNLTVPSGVFTLLAARITGAKAIAWLNDINVPGETVPDTPPFRIDYLLHHFMVPKFDALVVVSDAIARDFARGVRHIRVEGGIESSAFRHVAVRSDSPGFVIVSAGSLDEPNGIRVLLRAFSLLRGDRYKLRIAGAGPLEDEVRAAAAEDHRIDYLGYLSFRDVLRLYDSADVLVNLRLTASLNTKYFFPSKLIEYMASGRPVISTCTGHVEQEFGEVMYLVREETPEGLATVIRQVERGGKDASEAKGAAARGFVLANMTWDAQASKIVRMMDSLVAENPAQTGVAGR